MQKIKGKVKTLTEINYLIPENQAEPPLGDVIWKMVWNFDLNGNEIDKISLTKNDQQDARYLSSYDNQNNLIKKEIYNADNVLIHRSTYRYDDRNNKIWWKSTNWTPGLLWRKEKSVTYSYNYDERNNQVEEIHHLNKIFSRIKRVTFTYRYDHLGNMIEENWYNPDGSFDTKFTYRYDENGNKIEWNIYNNNNVLNGKSVFIYDKGGNKIEEKRFNADGEITSIFRFKYDENGNELKSCCVNSDKFLQEVHESHYDDKGNIIKEVWQKAENSDYRNYSYIYDDFDNHGNWLRRTVYLDENKPIEKIDRALEYYS